MKPQREYITAEVVILSPEEHGRTTALPPAAYGGYMPHIVLQSRQVREAKFELRDGQKHIADEYLGIQFSQGPHPVPISSPFVMTMLLMYAPDLAYDGVVAGAEFTIREGSKIVGHGKVISRTKEVVS